MEGHIGIDGEPGTVGPAGETGLPGLAGKKAIDGTNGPDGPIGPDGESSWPGPCRDCSNDNPDDRPCIECPEDDDIVTSKSAKAQNKADADILNGKPVKLTPAQKKYAAEKNGEKV